MIRSVLLSVGFNPISQANGSAHEVSDDDREHEAKNGGGLRFQRLFYRQLVPPTSDRRYQPVSKSHTDIQGRVAFRIS
jgi:hypothetical protein